MENDAQLRRERICACALLHQFGFKPLLARKLTDELGSAAAVFDLPARDRARLGLPSNAEEEAERELDGLARRGARFLALSEEAFPELLRDCPDAPPGLYVRSETPPEELFNRTTPIAVVGTRDISLYGKDCCPRIVGSLARGCSEKPAIVSGLALGVDIAAQLAALSFGLPTIGVLPTGIDEIYPRTHRVAAAKIAAAPGSALVTDYPPGTAPQPFTFLRRNRIIAGLSRATLVVESRIRGGALITARLAHEYGREVYAVPGRMDDPRSAGCNLLIRERVAEILPSPADLPAALGLGFAEAEKGSAKALEARIAAFAEGPQRDLLLRLAQLVAAERGLTVEELSARLDRPYAETSVLAGLLENEGILLRDLLGQCRINAEIV
ncbi:MAG: DNA-processing protein DprA [Bacteroidales bacterium]|nr:DNA-processing protein DprA [Bacteroidales bacterium]